MAYIAALLLTASLKDMMLCPSLQRQFQV